jgi:hypothetical protein
MFRALLYFFLIYLAYQFIFKFLIPVYKATQQIKKGVRNMSAQMNQSDNREDMKTQQFSPETKPDNKTSKEPAGDYIDFEEIK